MEWCVVIINSPQAFYLSSLNKMRDTKLTTINTSTYSTASPYRGTPTTCNNCNAIMFFPPLCADAQPHGVVFARQDRTRMW